MLSLIILGSALLALLSVTAAAPAPSPENSFEGLTPVEFKGKTLYVNTTALAKAPSSPVERSILQRRSNICGTSTIDPAPSGPYSQVSDCWFVRDYVNANDYAFTIHETDADYSKLIGYQSCTFKAGTYNYWDTHIGSGDVSDLLRDSINKWQSGGVVGARGQMGCPNAFGISGVHWAVVTV